jgi:AcrR family transcriptional regulator
MSSRMSVAERRRRLVDAAFVVVAREGLGAATTRAICDEATMSQSVFHYCFDSKRALLRELVSVTVRGLVDSAGEIAVPDPGATPADLRATLHATFDSLWQEACRHPDRQLALYELTTAALRDSELADLAGLQYRSYFAAMERSFEAIEEATRSTWVVPREVMARTAISFFDGLVLGWLSDGDDDAARRALDASVDALIALSRPAGSCSPTSDPRVW